MGAPAGHTDVVPAQARARAVIEELQLQEAATPISDNPRWQPRRLVDMRASY